MADVTPQAGRKEWIGLAVLALPCLLYSMDLTVLHLAVPKISEDLKPSSAQLLWIIDIYGFLVAGSLITMGTLGDRIGRRRLLLVGATAFGAASVLAAFSTTAEMLIATRAILGIAGATVAPSTLSLIRTMFNDAKQRSVAIAIWITSYSAGAAIGPLLGGLMLEFFWWGSVFLIAVPVMALLLVVGPRLLPEYRNPDAGRLDLPSAVLSLAAVLTVIFGVKQLAQDGLAWLPILSILVGLVLGILFIRRQQTLADPLIDLHLFRLPGFSASLAIYAFCIISTFGGFLFIPQYLQLVRDRSPLRAGLWSLPWAIAFIVGSMLTPFLARRIRPTYLMAGGFALASVGFAILARIDTTTRLETVVLASVIFALGVTPAFTLTTDLIVGSAPPEHAGGASAISETAAELGGALGIAILGSIGTAVYRHELADTMPSGVSPESAAAARDTLGGAVDLAGQLPAPLGSMLLDASRDAFVQGMQLAATLSAVGSVLLVVCTILLLRHTGAGPGPDAEPAEAISATADAHIVPAFEPS